MEPALELAGRAQFADGRPCGGVAVTVFEVDPSNNTASDPLGRPVGAAADGSFASGPLKSGRYWLAFAGGSPQVVRRVAGPFDAGTRDIRVDLVLGRTIRGRVVRPDGSPAKHVVVKRRPCTRRAGQRRRDRLCRRVRDRRSRRRRVHGLHEVNGCFAWTKDGVRAPGEPIEIRLDEGLAIAGVLTDSKGETVYSSPSPPNRSTPRSPPRRGAARRTPTAASASPR